MDDICVLLVLLDQPAHLQYLEPDVLAFSCTLPEGEDQVSSFDHVSHEEEEDVHALEFLQFVEHPSLDEVNAAEEDDVDAFLVQKLAELGVIAIDEVLGQYPVIFKQLQQSHIVPL